MQKKKVKIKRQCLKHRSKIEQIACNNHTRYQFEHFPVQNSSCMLRPLRFQKVWIFKINFEYLQISDPPFQIWKLFKMRDICSVMDWGCGVYFVFGRDLISNFNCQKIPFIYGALQYSCCRKAIYLNISSFQTNL